MIRKPDFSSGLKIVWFVLVSLLLGPFALWFALFAKKHRRHLQSDYFFRVLALAAGFLTTQLVIFLAPVHWAILLGLYLAACAGTAWALGKKERAVFFKMSANGKERGPASRERVGQSLLAAALAIYPLVYILSLLHNIGELENFSIHLPSDVYTDGLLWMLYVTPAVVLAGAAAWKASLRPGLRSLIYFYGSILVVLAWIMVWEKIDQYLLNAVFGFDRDPLFFSFHTEVVFRSVVKTFFYGSAFLLGIAYLVGAARTNVFLRRAVFLGLPSMLLYANMLFVIGDWNYYLAGIRAKAFEGNHFGLFRFASKAQLARTPAAYQIPEDLEEWAELEYQYGSRDKAVSLLKEIPIRCGARPYYARTRKRAERALASLVAVQSDKSVKPIIPGTLRLELPAIKPASYLDQEWYSLLSAVAFLKPSWNDLELKKRLLDLSNTVQLHLPKLENVPDLIPALRQLEIPVSPCFLTNERIKAALAAGHVPFLSLYGHWVPISGYDPGRNGFYYYSYQAAGNWNWFRNEDTDLFYHQQDQAFGGADTGADAGKAKPSMPARTGKTRPGPEYVGPEGTLHKFIAAEELEEHIIDIGGVGLILGDSAAAGTAERQAAFLVEQGDVYYQEHDNYEQAASAYRQAAIVFPNDQVFSRMIYLKRRYWEMASDPGDYQNLFRDYPPEWMARMGPAPKVEKEITDKIMKGALGSYLMMNWYVTPLPDSSEEAKSAMDTAMSLFTLLHKTDPEEPLYVDSLATLKLRRGDLAGSEKLFAELGDLYPFGSESAVFRLAWTKFKLGKVKELPALLDRCPSYAGEAKFLTLKAAVAMRQGHYRSAYSSLSRSLKLDKSIGESHGLMAEYYHHRGDKAAEQVHLQWQRRST